MQIGCLQYCLCVACIKFVNQAFFAWLPYYLHDEYGWKTDDADKLSTWYDIGAVVGTIAGGVISVGVGMYIQYLGACDCVFRTR